MVRSLVVTSLIKTIHHISTRVRLNFLRTDYTLVHMSPLLNARYIFYNILQVKNNLWHFLKVEISWHLIKAEAIH